MAWPAPRCLSTWICFGFRSFRVVTVWPDCGGSQVPLKKEGASIWKRTCHHYLAVFNLPLYNWTLGTNPKTSWVIKNRESFTTSSIDTVSRQCLLRSCPDIAPKNEKLDSSTWNRCLTSSLNRFPFTDLLWLGLAIYCPWGNNSLLGTLQLSYFFEVAYKIVQASSGKSWREALNYWQPERLWYCLSQSKFCFLIAEARFSFLHFVSFPADCWKRTVCPLKKVLGEFSTVFEIVEVKELSNWYASWKCVDFGKSFFYPHLLPRQSLFDLEIESVEAVGFLRKKHAPNVKRIIFFSGKSCSTHDCVCNHFHTARAMSFRLLLCVVCVFTPRWSLTLFLTETTHKSLLLFISFQFRFPSLPLYFQQLVQPLLATCNLSTQDHHHHEQRRNRQRPQPCGTQLHGPSNWIGSSPWSWREGTNKWDQFGPQLPHEGSYNLCVYSWCFSLPFLPCLLAVSTQLTSPRLLLVSFDSFICEVALHADQHRNRRTGERGIVATTRKVRPLKGLWSLDCSSRLVVSCLTLSLATLQRFFLCRCFMVHNLKEFVASMLPLWFRQSKFASFQRQLNLYGFQRITQGKKDLTLLWIGFSIFELGFSLIHVTFLLSTFSAGRDKGAYYHEYFLRSRPLLAQKIVRTKVKGRGARKASSPDTEPRFYDLPWMKDETKARSAPKQQQEQQKQENGSQSANGMNAAAAAAASSTATTSAPAPLGGGMGNASSAAGLIGRLAADPSLAYAMSSLPNSQNHHVNLGEALGLFSYNRQAAVQQQQPYFMPSTSSAFASAEQQQRQQTDAMNASLLNTLFGAGNAGSYSAMSSFYAPMAPTPTTATSSNTPTAADLFKSQHLTADAGSVLAALKVQSPTDSEHHAGAPAPLPHQFTVPGPSPF